MELLKVISLLPSSFPRPLAALSLSLSLCLSLSASSSSSSGGLDSTTHIQNVRESSLEELVTGLVIIDQWILQIYHSKWKAGIFDARGELKFASSAHWGSAIFHQTEPWYVETD